MIELFYVNPNSNNILNRTKIKSNQFLLVLVKVFEEIVLEESIKDLYKISLKKNKRILFEF
jgi:hypothetical protein